MPAKEAKVKQPRRPRQKKVEAAPVEAEEVYVPKVHTFRSGVPDGELAIEEVLWQMSYNPLFEATDEEQALVTEHFEALADAEAEAARLQAEAEEKAKAEAEADAEAASEEPEHTSGAGIGSEPVAEV